MKSSFPTVYVFPTAKDPIIIGQNLIFVATQDNEQFDKKTLENLSYQSNANDLLADTSYLENYYVSEMRTEDVPILTDNFSPVEIMINPVTSRPYFNEDSVFSQEESRIWFSESVVVKIGLLMAIVFAWWYLFRGIWKNSDIKIM